MTSEQRDAVIELCRRIMPHFLDDAARQCRENLYLEAASILREISQQLERGDPATIAGLESAVDLAAHHG